MALSPVSLKDPINGEVQIPSLDARYRNAKIASLYADMNLTDSAKNGNGDEVSASSVWPDELRKDERRDVDDFDVETLTGGLEKPEINYVKFLIENYGVVQMDSDLVVTCNEIAKGFNQDLKVIVLRNGKVPTAGILRNGLIILNQEIINRLDYYDELYALLSHESVHYDRGHVDIPVESDTKGAFSIVRDIGDTYVNESEADLVTSFRLNKAGYDTRALDRALRKIVKNRIFSHDLLHGNPLERIAKNMALHRIIEFPITKEEKFSDPLPESFKKDVAPGYLRRLRTLSPRSKEFYELLENAPSHVLIRLMKMDRSLISKGYSKIRRDHSKFRNRIKHKRALDRAILRANVVMNMFENRLNELNLPAKDKEILLGAIGVHFFNIKFSTLNAEDYYIYKSILNLKKIGSKFLDFVTYDEIDDLMNTLDVNKQTKIFQALGLPEDFSIDRANIVTSSFFKKIRPIKLKLLVNGGVKQGESLTSMFLMVRKIAKYVDKDERINFINKYGNGLLDKYISDNITALKRSQRRLVEDLTVVLRMARYYGVNSINRPYILYYINRVRPRHNKSKKYKQKNEYLSGLIYERLNKDDIGTIENINSSEEVINAINNDVETFIRRIGYLKATNHLTEIDSNYTLDALRILIRESRSDKKGELLKNSIKILNLITASGDFADRLKVFEDFFINDINIGELIKNISLDELIEIQELFYVSMYYADPYSFLSDRVKRFFPTQISIENLYGLNAPFNKQLNAMSPETDDIRRRVYDFYINTGILDAISDRILIEHSNTLREFYDWYYAFKLLVNGYIYPEKTIQDNVFGNDVYTYKLLSPFIDKFTILVDKVIKGFESQSVEEISENYKLIANIFEDSGELGLEASKSLQVRIIDSLSLKDSLEFIDYLLKNGLNVYINFSEFLENRIKTYEDYTLMGEYLNSISRVISEGYSLELGLYNALSLPIVDTNKIDMLKMLLGLNNNLMNYLMKSYFRYYYLLHMRMGPNAAKFKIIPFDVYFHIFRKDSVRFAILKNLLVSEKGLIAKEKYHYELVNVLISRIDGSKEQKNTIREILLATLKKGDKVKTFQIFYEILSPLIDVRENITEEDIKRFMKEVKKDMDLNTVLKTIGCSRKELPKIFEMTDESFIDQIILEIEREGGSADTIRKYRGMLKGIASNSGMDETTNEGHKEKLVFSNGKINFIDVIVRAGEGVAPIGPRALQVAGQFFEMSSEDLSRLRSVYDNVPGGSKFNAFLVLEQLAHEYPEWNTFLHEELVSINKRIAGGSMFSVFEIELRDGSTAILKVKNPNSEMWVREYANEMRNLLDYMEERGKIRYAHVAKDLLNTIGVWILEDLNDPNYIEHDDLFSSQFNNVIIGNTRFVISGNLSPYNEKAKLEVHAGSNYTLNKYLEDLAANDQKVKGREEAQNLVSSIRTYYINQITAPVQKDMYLVLSDLHPGNFIVQKVQGDGALDNVLYVLDRGYKLVFDENDAKFARFLFGTSNISSSSMLEQTIDYLLQTPENAELKLIRDELLGIVKRKMVFGEGKKKIRSLFERDTDKLVDSVDSTLKAFEILTKEGVTIPLRIRIFLKNVVALKSLYEDVGLEW